jgi:PASTA domain
MGLRKTACVLVSLSALGICASTAGAAPVSMTFTEARANVGVQLSDEALFVAPDTAPFAAQLDPASGAIGNGVLGVPDFATFIEKPIEADVTVDFNIGQITGSFDQTSGALSLTGVAGGTLTATGSSFSGEKCTVLAEPSPITLTTAGSSGGTANPRSGTPFAAGLAGSGAIAGEWADMSATPVEPGVVKNVNFCADVEKQIGGPGGIWMEQKVPVAPPAPQPSSPDLAPPTPSGTPPPACLVPQLAGRTLGRAKAAVRAANCTVGNVRRPRHRKGRKLGQLIVKSSNPSAGSALPAGSEVNLRLGRKAHKAPHS